MSMSDGMSPSSSMSSSFDALSLKEDPMSDFNETYNLPASFPSIPVDGAPAEAAHEACHCLHRVKLRVNEFIFDNLGH